jgi:hypothetical protein
MAQREMHSHTCQNLQHIKQENIDSGELIESSDARSKQDKPSIFPSEYSLIRAYVALKGSLDRELTAIVCERPV